MVLGFLDCAVVELIWLDLSLGGLVSVCCDGCGCGFGGLL